MTNRFTSAWAILFAIATGLALLTGGGLVMRICYEAVLPGNTEDFQLIPLLVTFAASACTAGLCGFLLKHPSRRRYFFAAVMCCCTSIALVYLTELFWRGRIPAWPARALHGVPPALWAQAMSRTVPGVTMPAGTQPEWNSWGQRDRERTLVPNPGIYRIALIGDSFLEEGASPPLGLATEEHLARPDVEVVNLGVSATGPDEYYERLRSVAAPLGARHCVWCVFSGNDFVSPARTLQSWWSVAAVEPRPALLTSVGLAGWNYSLTNNRRPVLEAWFSGATLNAEEQQRAQILRQATDNDIRMLLLQAMPANDEQFDRLKERLQSRGSSRLLDMLRHPDDDRFRSYYLTAALQAASTGETWASNSEEIAWFWTAQAAEYCRRTNMAFTVLIIPEAFQVDDRMREQWLPLTDMRICTATCRTASQRFAERVRQAGIDLVDLHQPLADSRGTYLNLDGHWSAAGVALVSEVLARHLRSIIPTRQGGK